MAVRSRRVARSSATVRVSALALATACLVAACSEGVERRAEPSPSPSPSDSPSGADLNASPSAPATPTRLAVGKSATITLSTGQRSGKAAVTVTRVRKGKIKDLSDFVLDKRTRRSTPYYADVRVKNTGSTNLAGATPPLWGLDSTETVLPAAQIRGTFGKCDNTPLPKRFGKGDRARTCLMFLVPEGAALKAVQYRPSDESSGVFSWPAS